eukprot:Pgem_evm1s326
MIWLYSLNKLLTCQQYIGLFADDLTGFGTFMSKKQAELPAQNMLDIIAEWIDKWRTKLGIPKTNYLLITCTGANKSKHELKLTYQDHPIKRDPNPVLLGITLDKDWKFEQHGLQLLRKLNNKKRFLYEIKGTHRGANNSTLVNTYSYNSLLIRSNTDQSALPIIMK